MEKELADEIMETMSALSCARKFIDFQNHLKGESVFLHCLDRMGGESSPSDLAKELNMSGPRISAIISHLEFKLLVVRASSSIDKRKRVVKITKKGRELVKNTHDYVGSYISEVVDILGKEEAENLLKILKKLVDSEFVSEKKGVD